MIFNWYNTEYVHLGLEYSVYMAYIVTFLLHLHLNRTLRGKELKKDNI